MQAKTFWILAGLGVLVAYGCGGGSRGNIIDDGVDEEYQLSVTRMRDLATGMLLYINDHDDIYPPANRWMDALDPYVEDENAFVSPAVAGRGYGYAFNAALAGTSANDVQDPYNTVLIFDSTVLTRNATAPTSTMPNPPRYPVTGRNTISYANGRVDGIGGASTSASEIALDRLRHVSVGLALYASDHDDHLPLGNAWVDGTMPYVRVDQYYRSPALAHDPNAYGFALNAEIAGRSVFDFETPATTFSVFDSTVLTRNATALPTTRPSPTRYPNGNAEAFLDGHVALGQ